jgi:antirestriction protein
MTTEYKKPSNSKQEELSAIYVADLADYNAGILRGCWIEINSYTSEEEILEKIHEMLAEKGHEEYEVHDFENIPGAAELSKSGCFSSIIEVVTAVEQFGYDLVAAYISNFGIDELSQMEDRYLGTYENLEHYVRESLDYSGIFESVPKELVRYFDYEAYAEDLDASGEVVGIEVPGRICMMEAIFRND